MTAMTLEQAVQFTGTEVYDYLDKQAEVPVVTTAACQGDVSILRVTKTAAVKPLPKAGLVVSQAGSGGHAHSLHGNGFFDAAPEREGSLVIGRLTVPAETDVILSHPEHGALLLAPGTYEVGAQQEFAGEWRRVAD